MRRLALVIGFIVSACGSTSTGELAQGSDGGSDEAVVVSTDDAAAAGDSSTVVAPDASPGQDAVASWDAVVPRDARTMGVPSGPVDCAWLADDNNCYKRTLAAADVCLPPSNAKGTLSQDLKSCTYADGTTILFDSALVLPTPQGTAWNFTVSKLGQACLRYEEERQKRYSLTTPGGAFDEVVTSTGGLTVICPDGKSYTQDNGLSLLGCDGGFLGGLPGNSNGSTMTSVTFSLLGAAGGKSVTIFNCQKAQ